MPQPPDQPKIYHIVHIDRLASIVSDGNLWCDAAMTRRAGGGTVIGMNGIKQRRLTLPVTCHPGDYVGDYVPFYFCPRSIMLFLIYKANHPELEYRGGQGPILHLEADLHAVIEWAEANQRRWTFSLTNAGARYAQFRARVEQLDEVNWAAVNSMDFRDPEIKEGKQAEYLVQGTFPWQLIERIGASSANWARRAVDIIRSGEHRPVVEIRQDWYY